MAPAPEDQGMGSHVDLSATNSLVIVSFLTIAWYNVVELTVLIHTFFKRHSGFYYYSLLVSTLGIFLHGLGNFFKFYKIINAHTLTTVISYSGWVMMVTGQSIVLYSRLHLVVQAPWKRWILVMIIVNAVVLHVTTGVLTFLTNLSKDPKPWKGPYSVVERVQITLFFIQELILSGIYIWKTTVMLRSEGPLFNRKENARGDRGRKVLAHTVLINLFIIALDIVLIALEFSGLYDIQTTFKTGVYSVKLKLEFTILNQLMNLVKGNLSDHSARSYTGGPAHRSGLRSGVKPSTNLGNSTGAYSKMDDRRISAQGDIKLHDLKSNDVLKTTTTEVRFERMDDIESVDSESRGKGLRRSSSSEVYIIDKPSDRV
ncbi:hypothetical protein B0J11DRAFT_496008 [Dendryphion nanum]|uniref:DUF7703 domain-containing protein n=1 Tax=Dendryphion nanum TaxID=256645 RepID=A0A9P9ICV8_9PLEO|nr:hypothetical protein B0J11DRAFT_496008 [Dendryphion nanum]